MLENCSEEKSLSKLDFLFIFLKYLVIQLGSVIQSCLTLCNPMDYSTPGLPVHHQLPQLARTHIHQVGDAIQPSYPLSSPSPLTFNLSHHQGLLLWVNPSDQVTKLFELQLQHQSFQWIFRTDFLYDRRTAYCSPRGRKESDTTEWLNWTEGHLYLCMYVYACVKRHLENSEKTFRSFLLFLSN